MFKVVAGLKASSTNASMLVNILLLFEVLTWTLEFLNAKITGNGVTWYSHVESKDPSASNTIVLTSQKTIANLDGAVKWTQKQTLCDLKQREGSCVHTLSNALIAGVITKPTQIYVHSGGIGLTGSSTRRNMLSSVKTGSNCFVQLWTVSLNNDYQRP